MISSHKTERSRINEYEIQKIISDYDTQLKLRFSGDQGYYYISRLMNPRSWSDTDASIKEMLYNKGSVYAEALTKKELVVCTPIPVWMMECRDVAIRNIMRHLKMNDMYAMGTSHKDRVRNAINENDGYWDNFDKQNKTSGLDNINHLGREYYRDHVIPKSSLAGIKTSGAI